MRVRQKPAGFTLVEVVLVIMTLGILTLTLIPQDNLGSFDLEMAAQKVEQEIRYAKHLATITNINCGVNFVATQSYTVYQQSTNNPVLSPHTREALVTNLSSQFKNVNVLNNVQFEFDSLGRPVLGGGQTVQIGNGVSTISLLLTPSTGVIQRQ